MYNTVLFWWLDRNTKNICIVTMISPTKNKKQYFSYIWFAQNTSLSALHYNTSNKSYFMMWKIYVHRRRTETQHCLYFPSFHITPNSQYVVLDHYRNCTKPPRNGNFEDVFEKLTDSKTNCTNFPQPKYSLQTKSI